MKARPRARRVDVETWVTVKRVASVLPVSERQVRRWCEAGRIPATRTLEGGPWLVSSGWLAARAAELVGALGASDIADIPDIADIAPPRRVQRSRS